MGNGSGYGHLGVGWTLAGNNLPGGLLRLSFAFPMGLLLSRLFRPVAVRGAFWLCSLSIIALLSGLSSTVGVLLSLPKLMGAASDELSANIYGLEDYLLLAAVIAIGIFLFTLLLGSMQQAIFYSYYGLY